MSFYCVTAPSASYIGQQISLFVSCVLSQTHATSVIVTFSHTPHCFFVKPSAVNQAAPLNFPHCAAFLSLKVVTSQIVADSGVIREDVFRELQKWLVVEPLQFYIVKRFLRGLSLSYLCFDTLGRKRCKVGHWYKQMGCSLCILQLFGRTNLGHFYHPVHKSLKGVGGGSDFLNSCTLCPESSPDTFTLSITCQTIN